MSSAARRSPPPKMPAWLRSTCGAPDRATNGRPSGSPARRSGTQHRLRVPAIRAPQSSDVERVRHVPQDTRHRRSSSPRNRRLDTTVRRHRELPPRLPAARPTWRCWSRAAALNVESRSSSPGASEALGSPPMPIFAPMHAPTASRLRTRLAVKASGRPVRSGTEASGTKAPAAERRDRSPGRAGQWRDPRCGSSASPTSGREDQLTDRSARRR